MHPLNVPSKGLRVELFWLCFLLLTAQAFRLGPSRERNTNMNTNMNLNMNNGVDEKSRASLSALIKEGDYSEAFSLLKKEPLRQIAFDDAIALRT